MEHIQLNFYRYEMFVSEEVITSKLTLNEFCLVKETPMGYWIVPNWISEYEKIHIKKYQKWIPKKSLSRYAYPTKEEALKHYVERTKKRKRILERQIQLCDNGLRIAEDLKNKLLEQ